MMLHLKGRTAWSASAQLGQDRTGPATDCDARRDNCLAHNGGRESLLDLIVV